MATGRIQRCGYCKMAVRSMSSPSRSRSSLVPQDKGAVILDIGHSYTRIGFSGEPAPRHIIRSSVLMKPYGEVVDLWDKKYINREELYLIMCRFLSKVYLQCLMINPRDYRVVIVESILCPSNFRNSLAKSLFVHFSVPNVCFLPHHLACLFTIGTLTALVIDIGDNEMSVVPVYEGVPLINSIMVTTVATSSLCNLLQQMLVDHCKVKDTTNTADVPISSVTKLFGYSVLTDIITKTCFARPLSQGDKTPLDINYLLDSRMALFIPGFVRHKVVDVLFHGTIDDISIPVCVLEALLHCPIDCRQKLCANIVITGNCGTLPGFKLKEEMKFLCSKESQYRCLDALELKFHMLLSNSNYTAWQGASIIGAVEPAVMERSISKDDFKLRHYQLPEWMSCDSEQWESLRLSPRKHAASPAQQKRINLATKLNN